MSKITTPLNTGRLDYDYVAIGSSGFEGLKTSTSL